MNDQVLPVATDPGRPPNMPPDTERTAPAVPDRGDLPRTTLGVLVIAGLMISSYWVLVPFIPSVVWAATLVVATWPLMLRVQAALGNLRTLAVAVMTLALLLVFVVPLWLAIKTIVQNADQIGDLAQSVVMFRLPVAPDWVANLPLVGDSATQAWNHFADTDLRDLAPQVTPYARQLTQWVAGAAGGLGLVFVQFLLTVVMAAIMYAHGEAAAHWARRFGHRLAGSQGSEAVRLVGQAVRGVALGVVVTAVVQAVLGGIGLAVVGVPFAPVLTALMFMCCIAQVGPAPVLVPAVIWMYASGASRSATILLVISIVVVSLDNFLRPILIRKGANLPLLLVLCGVIGGLLAFGLVGIFLGPAILAATYTLLEAWMSAGDAVARPTSTLNPGLDADAG